MTVAKVNRNLRRRKRLSKRTSTSMHVIWLIITRGRLLIVMTKNQNNFQQNACIHYFLSFKFTDVGAV